MTGAGSLEESLVALTRPGLLVIVTRGASGSVAASTEGVIECPAHQVPAVVDTTGAGDLFAAGVLYGITRREGLARSLHLGSLAAGQLAEQGRVGLDQPAGEIIGHLGARPRVSLTGLVEGV